MKTINKAARPSKKDWQSLLVAILITTSALLIVQYLKQQTRTAEALRAADTRISQQVATTKAYAQELQEVEEKKAIEAEKQVEAEQVAAAEAAQEAVQTVSEPETVESAPEPQTPVLDPNFKVNPTEIMDAAGIPAIERVAVNFIISSESGWRPFVWNSGGSGAYGLCQALPGSKMAVAGADWETNPVTQLRWCTMYAEGKGGWIAAANLWRGQGWW